MIKSIKLKTKPENNFAAYKDCVADLLCSETVRSMKNFLQHNKVTCLQHCLYVSYISYKVCKIMKFDYLSAARGGMLHDFFLYDWHITKHGGLHGFTHSAAALENADRLFCLNDLEKDIILKHMWPLTIRMPRYKESFVVLIIDKYCASMEIFSLYNKNKISRLMNDCFYEYE